jgi:predicted GIY-YIG superfamily endonuclease
VGRGRLLWAVVYLSSEGVKRPFVYIMASRRNGTLYVGVTSDLARRIAEHRDGAIAGFTKRYGCKLLVWMEPYDRMDEAITREKQIKAGSRKDKLALIERENPRWSDLYKTLNA